MLRKRKRQSSSFDGEDKQTSLSIPGRKSTLGTQDAPDILRRHFESQFGDVLQPISQPPRSTANGTILETDLISLDSEEEWNGISTSSLADESNDEPFARIPTIDYSSASSFVQQPLPSKSEVRAFCAGKACIPSAGSQQLPTSLTSSPGATPADPTDALNLSNDLALQRLLSESHLLHASGLVPSTSSSSVFSLSDTTKAPPSAGQLRQKRQEHHLTTSLLHGKTVARVARQEAARVPMKIRTGIQAKAEQREKRRRIEAKAAGIVLERFGGAGKAEKRRRGGGRKVEMVGGPTVGKFRKGLLTLSKRDVIKIQGHPDSQRKKRKR